MASKTATPRPFLKWAGGKRQLVPDIRKHTPTNYHTYFEPFLGAGAVFFDLQPNHAIVNDMNAELINAYHVIKNDVEGLISHLASHRNEKEYYYQLRDRDRDGHLANLTPVERASRMVFLNKTCYNGLFRVNRQGHFNVPYGRYVNPKIIDQVNLRAIHAYLNAHDIQLVNGDFERAVADAKQGDFVYFDPPYDPVSDTASFTGYHLRGFDRHEQIRLKETFATLSHRGCHVMLSNSATPFIEDLYREYNIVKISATRAINSNPNRRGKIAEVLIMNY